MLIRDGTCRPTWQLCQCVEKHEQSEHTLILPLSRYAKISNPCLDTCISGLHQDVTAARF
jgi:hypothetical protein